MKKMIDSILDQRAKGNNTVLLTTRTKLILKGINPDKYTTASPDDDAVIAQLRGIASDLGVSV